MARCIYCQVEKAADCYQKVEHVMPQSFGRFRNNLTLVGVVCDECNQYFGDHLEIALARDSYEGGSRFRYGVKDASEFKPFGRSSRLVFRVGEGEYLGAYAYREYSPEAQDVVVNLFPQVGFLSFTSKTYNYYLLDEIPESGTLADFDAANPRAFLALRVDEQELRERLAEKKFALNVSDVPTAEQQKSVLVSIEGNIDTTIRRAIAKIAFNYLARFQGAAFVHQAAFDAIRRYIRYGELPPYAFFEIRDEAILGDEPEVGQRRLGHLITNGIGGDGRSILGQVSLFNWVTYKIALAVDFGDVPHEVVAGSFFDTSTHTILELESRPKTV